jgi:LmbE family N-acetylglucosaminyl deacetylase
MQQLVCIFAHPDDEAFGPGGTIALLSQTYEITIICVTNGDDSRMSDEKARALGAVRREELRRSASLLGVKSVLFLDYQDGKLCNGFYHEIAEKLERKFKELRPSTLLTFEPRGVSGHIDHIAVSMITSYVFEKLPFIEELLYYCISEQNRALHEDYFIYFPPGYSKAEIDKVVDVAPVWDMKVKAMHEHVSQRADAERILKRSEKLPKEEYFLVKRKDK